MNVLKFLNCQRPRQAQVRAGSSRTEVLGPEQDSGRSFPALQRFMPAYAKLPAESART